jgi:hypothetical protein
VCSRQRRSERSETLGAAANSFAHSYGKDPNVPASLQVRADFPDEPPAFPQLAVNTQL